MNRRNFLSSALAFGAAAALSGLPSARAQGAAPSPFRKLIKSDEEWKRVLTPEQYYVTRQKGTERPYSSPLLNEHRAGTFACVCCELPLFSSATKFESHTGWPSFWSPISKQNVTEEVDDTLPGERRTEVLCARCDA